MFAETNIIIFTCPVGAYYSSAVPVKIETEFTRAVKGGTGFAKAAGNYAAALYPAKLGQDQGYTQLIWTDAEEHKYIEEAGMLPPKSLDTVCVKKGLVRGYTTMFEWEPEDE